MIMAQHPTLQQNQNECTGSTSTGTSNQHYHLPEEVLKRNQRKQQQPQEEQPTQAHQVREEEPNNEMAAKISIPQMMMKSAAAVPPATVAKAPYPTSQSNHSIKTNLRDDDETLITPLRQHSCDDNLGNNKKTTASKQQQQQQGQDSKRTLIKNQLYLIEQLQLENANLRNERDQLQLENEELKFQLQMISSSNILSQSGSSAFDEVVVKTTTAPTTTATSNGANQSARANGVATENNNLPMQANAKQANDYPHLHQSNHAMQVATGAGRALLDKASVGGACGGDQNIIASTNQSDSSVLTKITATPVRQPLRLMNCDDLTGGAARDERAAAPANAALGRSLFPVSANDFELATKQQQQAGTAIRQAQPVPPSSVATSKLLSAKSSSLSGFNVKPANLVSSSSASASTLLAGASGSAASNDHLVNLEEHDDRARQRLVQQLYGDCDKVQAAAIVIQRAFRKYQICKRFRAITEQLRHTCQAGSPIRRKRQSISGQDGDDDDDDEDHHSDQDGISSQLRHSSSSRERMSTKNTSSDSPSVPYASGATRAAAWESLSQAASRLAASAAAATANATKQTLVAPSSGKLAAYQQVASTKSSPTRPNATTTTTSSSSITTVASDGSSSGRGSSVAQSSQSRSDSVVAAAINFQQLESIRKRQYRVGLNIFNKTPEKGISFLIAHSFIDCSPPYTKTSTSYYLSNQLHFIDKQHLTAQQQTISPGAEVDSTNETMASAILEASRRDCRFCFEEDNLKRNVAHFLLHRKGLAKEKIGQYLGNLQCKFNQDVLVHYLRELDFYGLQIDVALRKFSSTLRMPGEAQKIERFVDRFAHRYVQCQLQAQPTHVSSNEFMNAINSAPQPPPIHLTDTTANANGSTAKGKSDDAGQLMGTGMNKNNLTLLTKDEIFILTFAIIMLNTDLHSPSLKSTNRMSANQFINNLRGVFKSQTINENDLIEIYERVKANQITTTPDHVTHVMKVQQGLTTQNFQKKELPNLCVPHRRLVCFCRLFEVYDVNKKERAGQHQREIFLFNDMLLVTKLARRARANTPQQYTYRQSIPLKGLYVQLFQSAHYNYGLRLCQRSNEETLIMFNARNELDQSRFVDDLNESIAEMDEMESIRAHNIIETIHFKQQDRLRRHAMMHDPTIVSGIGKESNNKNEVRIVNEQTTPGEDNDEDPFATSASNVTVIQAKGPSHPNKRMPSKFSSMSNLTSVVEILDENDPEHLNSTQTTSAGKQTGDSRGLRPNRSFVHNHPPTQKQSNHYQREPHQLQMRHGNHMVTSSGGAMQRSCSSNSIHSLDSGLFLSRDVSPNQSG